MSEVSEKLANVRKLMSAHALAGVVFRGVDWFSWITAGGSSSVIMTSETGVADVLITSDGAWILTSKVEDPRLREEEFSELLGNGLELAVFPWQDGEAFSKFVNERTGGGRVASDRPRGNETSLPPAFTMLKRILSTEEIARYRQLGRSAAEAMTEVMLQAEPTWTEYDLAGAGAEACWSRGLEPTLILVAGEERGLRHRHPLPKANVLGQNAMMVFCARAYGLYANFTRYVYFSEPSVKQREKFDQLRAVESFAFKATKPGNSIRDVYASLSEGYKSVGLPGQIQLHHQGGPCGYLSRDLIATPETPMNEKVESSMAFAWNPSLPGAKIEDTILCRGNELEILTVDPRWPTISQDGYLRPDVLVKG